MKSTKIRLETYVNGEMARELEELASSAGKEPSTIIEEALADYLSSAVYSGEPATDLLERVRRYQRLLGTPPLSEDEAMELANEEVHKYRDEHPEVYLKTDESENAGS